MKIHALELTGIGPYPGTEKIDFEKLNEEGTFVFSGPTGAGKSTILDAITFALFGEVPRGSSDRELVSTLRSTTDTPRVVLEVTVGGRRLRIERIPAHDRRHKNRKGIGEKPESEIEEGDLTTEPQTLLVEELIDNVWTPISDVTKVQSRGPDTLEPILGMTARQFEQVVLLPQGQFDQFLKADPAERQKLLKALFPGTELGSVEQWFEQRAKDDEAARSAKEGEIHDCLTRVDNVALRAQADDPALPQRPQPPIEASELLDWTSSLGRAVEDRLSKATTASESAAKALALAEKELNTATEQNEKAARRRDCEKTLAVLEQKVDWSVKTRDEIDRARKSLVAKGRIDDLDECSLRKSDLVSEESKAGQALADLGHDPNIPNDALSELETGASLTLKSVTEFLDTKVDLLAQLGSQSEALEARKRELEGEAPPELVEANKTLEQAERARKAGDEKLEEIRELRVDGMAADLAALLDDGEPCMVCGSMEHPQPAARADGHPGDHEEEQAKAALAKATNDLEDARRERERVLVEIESERSSTTTELEGLSERIQRLTEERGELLGSEPTLEARRERLAELIEAVGELKATRQRLIETENQLAELQRKAEDQIRESGFANRDEVLTAFLDEQEIERRESQLDSYNQELAETSALLKGELADVDGSKVIELSPLQDAVEASKRKASETASNRGTAESDRDDFIRETAQLPELLEELASLRATAARSDRLSRELRGKEGSRLSLTNYVLAERLKRVIEAANVHLARISDNQYQLRFDAQSTQKDASGGLGIKVADNKAARDDLMIRSPKTLSGGESFYTSLSLALGVALVVQAESGGRPLETLFIDEGFGSLDPETLDEVLNVIEAMRQEGRTIGLVSHVNEMKERIAARVVITPSDQGSNLDLEIGV